MRQKRSEEEPILKENTSLLSKQIVTHRSWAYWEVRYGQNGSYLTLKYNHLP